MVITLRPLSKAGWRETIKAETAAKLLKTFLQDGENEK